MKRIARAVKRQERKGAAEVRREEKTREADLSLLNLPRTPRAALTTLNPRRSLKNKDRSFQEEAKRLDMSAGLCVMLLQNCSCPVEPFQHQQSPGQKTNLASQGLSVKKDVWGVKEAGIFFFL